MSPSYFSFSSCPPHSLLLLLVLSSTHTSDNDGTREEITCGGELTRPHSPLLLWYGIAPQRSKLVSVAVQTLICGAMWVQWISCCNHWPPSSSAWPSLYPSAVLSFHSRGSSQSIAPLHVLTHITAPSGSACWSPLSKKRWGGEEAWYQTGYTSTRAFSVMRGMTLNNSLSSINNKGDAPWSNWGDALPIQY